MCALAGLLSVAPLEIWSYGWAPFWVIFWTVSAPGFVLLAAVGWTLSRRRPADPLLAGLRAGVVGGAAGLVAYDLVRAPFAALGVRLFAPNSSYGLLLLNESTSSPLTEFAGWSYHAANGLGFAVAYAVVFRGRRWWYAIPYALLLETLAIATPTGSVYAVRGNAPVIAVAYLGHIAFAIPLGLIVERAGTPREVWFSAPLALAAVAVALLVWFHPFVPQTVPSVTALTSGPSTAIVSGLFQPQWIRVPPGGCATVRNTG